VIRHAKPEDAAHIAALWNWMIRDTLATFTTEEKRLGDLEEMIRSRRDAFYVDTDAGLLRGFATFGPFRQGPGYAHTCEHSIIVDPAHHTLGIGRGLLAQIEKAARAAGQHVMIGAISSANPDALRFHLSCGFVQSGHLPQVGRKAGQWLDLILVQKTLSADI
jgi:phosphinothricin acetyltransferase